MEKYGKFIEIDAEGYKVYRCPFCGEEYGLGDYFDDGILWDVSCSCGASIKEADFDKALFIKEE